MVSPVTVKQWQQRLVWPIMLSAGWFILYTSARLFDATYAYSERNVVQFLFSPQHLSQPLGWLFLLSLCFVLVGLCFRAYLSWAGY